jgi:hypothetical protein
MSALACWQQVKPAFGLPVVCPSLDRTHGYGRLPSPNSFPCEVRVPSSQINVKR